MLFVRPLPLPLPLPLPVLGRALALLLGEAGEVLLAGFPTKGGDDPLVTGCFGEFLILLVSNKPGGWATYRQLVRLL